jgi:serpin B
MAEPEVANRFGLHVVDLQRRRYPQDNVAVCPPTLARALSALGNGARGRTRQQLADLLSLRHTTHASRVATMSDTDAGRPVRADAAALWAASNVRLRQEFVDAVTASGVDVQSTDFADPRAAAIVNAWVSARTRGHIEEIVDAGTLGAGTVLVVLTALYFKDRWRESFDPAQTSSGGFQRADGQSIEVPLMHRTCSLPFFADEHCRAIDLPFASDGLRLRVVLPLAPSPHPPAVEEAFQRLDLGEVRTVHLSIPRFAIDTSADLREPLTRLGLGDMFSPEADFSGVSDHNAQVGTVRERVTFVVDEHGAEAAAATAVSLIRSFDPSEARFDINRPFYCAIRNARTNELIVIAYVSDPLRGRSSLA